MKEVSKKVWHILETSGTQCSLAGYDNKFWNSVRMKKGTSLLEISNAFCDFAFESNKSGEYLLVLLRIDIWVWMSNSRMKELSITYIALFTVF